MLVADTNGYHGLINGVAYRDAKEPDGSNHPAIIMKATEGTSFVDPQYAPSLAQARAAGLMTGHYFFLDANIDAAAQGTFFGQVVKAHGGLHPGDSIWCDCEQGAGNQAPRVQAALNAAHVVLGDNPADEGFYSGAAFFAAHLGTVPSTQYHRWIASYGSPAPADGEELFQFTDAKAMAGVQGNCDASIYNGTADQYRASFGAPPAGPPPSNVIPGNLKNAVLTLHGVKGYWIVQADGGVFSYEGAPFYGSLGNVKLAKPISCGAVTKSGMGYYLVAQDGGVFSFGDARYYGSTGGQNISNPIIGISISDTGNGYRLIDSNGTTYHFGDA